MVTFANIMFSLYFCLVGKEKNRPREKVAERSTKSGKKSFIVVKEILILRLRE